MVHTTPTPTTITTRQGIITLMDRVQSLLELGPRVIGNRDRYLLALSIIVRPSIRSPFDPAVLVIPLSYCCFGLAFVFLLLTSLHAYERTHARTLSSYFITLAPPRLVAFLLLYHLYHAYPIISIPILPGSPVALLYFCMARLLPSLTLTLSLALTSRSP